MMIFNPAGASKGGVFWCLIWFDVGVIRNVVVREASGIFPQGIQLGLVRKFPTRMDTAGSTYLVIELGPKPVGNISRVSLVVIQHQTAQRIRHVPLGNLTRVVARPFRTDARTAAPPQV